VKLLMKDTWLKILDFIDFFGKGKPACR